MMDLANQNDSSSTILRLTNIVILGLLTITTICNDKTKRRGIKSWEYMPKLAVLPVLARQLSQT